MSISGAAQPAMELGDRLAIARAHAVATCARAAELQQWTQHVLAEAQAGRRSSAEARGERRSSPAVRDLMRRSGYARLLARLESMPVIEQAKGIIMAQSHCAGRAADLAAATWRSVTPWIAGTPHVRVSRDGGRTYPARHARPLPADPPDQPCTVPVYDPGTGTGRMLALDLDPARGRGRGSSDPAAQVSAQAEGLAGLVTRLGGRCIADVAPSGGRHVYVVFTLGRGGSVSAGRTHRGQGGVDAGRASRVDHSGR